MRFLHIITGCSCVANVLLMCYNGLFHIFAGTLPASACCSCAIAADAAARGSKEKKKEKEKETCFHETLGLLSVFMLIRCRRWKCQVSFFILFCCCTFSCWSAAGGKNVRSLLPIYWVSLQVYFALMLGLFYARIFSVWIFLFYPYGKPLYRSISLC